MILQSEQGEKYDQSNSCKALRLFEKLYRLDERGELQAGTVVEIMTCNTPLQQLRKEIRCFNCSTLV